MKKCEPFKDMILTDYVDGELDNKSAASLGSHLLDCNDCRAFLKEVKNNATLPFHKAMHQQVPTELWDNIKQNLEHENQGTSPLSEFIEKLKGLIVYPKLVPVFASLILMLLTGSITLNTINLRQAQAKDQGEYLVSLLSTTGSSSGADNNDLGTPIEHYFL